MVKAQQAPVRNDVWLVSLNPTQGSEINKTRPAVIISPDEMNNNLNTLIVAPMTTTMKKWPSRININFEGTAGQIALDQIRALDKARFKKRLGKVEENTAKMIFSSLIEMFK